MFFSLTISQLNCIFYQPFYGLFFWIDINMQISETDIERLAKLVNLNFTQEEKQAMCKHIESFLSYVAKLKEQNLDDIQPTYSVPSDVQPLREDKIEESLIRENCLKNVPDKKDGFIRVPKIIKKK